MFRELAHAAGDSAGFLRSCWHPRPEDRSCRHESLQRFRRWRSTQDAVELPLWQLRAMGSSINQLDQGANRNRLEAKVFGGAAVLRGFTTVQVGEMNSQFVLEYLETRTDWERLSNPPGKIHPRKVYSFSANGRVMVRNLKAVHNNTIVERERDYSQRLKSAELSGDVELFS